MGLERQCVRIARAVLRRLDRGPRQSEPPIGGKEVELREERVPLGAPELLTPHRVQHLGVPAPVRDVVVDLELDPIFVLIYDPVPDPLEARMAWALEGANKTDANIGHYTPLYAVAET